jgi:hypothetical protein
MFTFARNWLRRAGARLSEVARNLGTAIFYKGGGRTWRVSDIRDGTYCLGSAFKKDETGGILKIA